jgi:hypothetical protein
VKWHLHTSASKSAVEFQNWHTQSIVRLTNKILEVLFHVQLFQITETPWQITKELFLLPD